MRMRARWFSVLILVLLSGLLLSGAEKDCTFLKNPNDFLIDVERIHTKRSDLSSRLAAYFFAAQSADSSSTVAPASMPRKNFIDEYIFGRMAGAGIQSAPLASDGEFVRRVTLDLTGRIPSGADVDAF